MIKCPISPLDLHKKCTVFLKNGQQQRDHTNKEQLCCRVTKLPLDVTRFTRDGIPTYCCLTTGERSSDCKSMLSAKKRSMEEHGSPSYVFKKIV